MAQLCLTNNTKRPFLKQYFVLKVYCNTTTKTYEKLYINSIGFIFDGGL